MFYFNLYSYNATNNHAKILFISIFYYFYFTLIFFLEKINFISINVYRFVKNENSDVTLSFFVFPIFEEKKIKWNEMIIFSQKKFKRYLKKNC